MARTRVVVRRRPNINFDLRRVAAAKKSPIIDIQEQITLK